MLTLIDNYDSFTYNLVHFLGELGAATQVYRNDKVTVDEVLVESPEAIVLSPGPCDPDRAGICLELIERAAPVVPILGVCLGHQAIGQAFGGKLVNLSTVYHGVATPVNIDPNVSNGLFEGLPNEIEAGRYHSWVISDENFPAELEITARDNNNYIMALQHKKFDVQGVQFHPESVLTPKGEIIMKNWLNV